MREITLEQVDIVFHFNKAHLANPTVPMWVIKAKGETLYVNHVDFKNVSFSTKETPDNLHTKGSLKFKKANLALDREGKSAIIYSREDESSLTMNVEGGDDPLCLKAQPKLV